MSLEAAFEIGQLTKQVTRIADVITASQQDIFVLLPGLRAYWPMGIRVAAGTVIDHSSAGTPLTMVGTCPTGFDGNSFCRIGNGANYLTSAATLGVTGGETYIDATDQGLTIGGWFFVNTAPVGANVGIVTKAAGPPNRGYALFMSPTVLGFTVSGNGSNFFDTSLLAYSIGQWNFIVGRFKPSTEVAVFLNGTKGTNTTAIPATLNVSPQTFEVGRWIATSPNIAHMQARDLFLCATALDDDVIEIIRQTSSP